MLVVIHDLHKHGAQYLALNFLRTLKGRFGFEVAAISGEPGELAAAYEREGRLYILDRDNSGQIDATAEALRRDGFETAIVNSSAAGWIAPYLARAGIRFIGLVHEMPSIIKAMTLEKNLRAFDARADRIVFPSAIVRDKAARAADVAGWRNADILPQGLYKNELIASYEDKELARRAVAQRLGAPEGARFVIGVGYADHRKGVDIFLDWAVAAASRWDDVCFVWLGGVDPQMQKAVTAGFAKAGGARARLFFPGFVEDTGIFYRAAALYALTSREDPFPSTPLEAMAAGAPVVMVAGTSGLEDLAAAGADQPVRAIADADSAGFVEAAARWLDDPQALRRAGEAGRALVASQFGFESYVGELLRRLDIDTPKISVIVPNFNYGRYLEKRLASVLDQTLPPFEIIFLDDAVERR